VLALVNIICEKKWGAEAERKGWSEIVSVVDGGMEFQPYYHDLRHLLQPATTLPSSLLRTLLSIIIIIIIDTTYLV